MDNMLRLSVLYFPFREPTPFWSLRRAEAQCNGQRLLLRPTQDLAASFDKCDATQGHDFFGREAGKPDDDHVQQLFTPVHGDQIMPVALLDEKSGWSESAMVNACKALIGRLVQSHLHLAISHGHLDLEGRALTLWASRIPPLGDC